VANGSMLCKPTTRFSTAAMPPELFPFTNKAPRYMVTWHRAQMESWDVDRFLEGQRMALGRIVTCLANRVPRLLVTFTMP
jgi:hypothetical protein